MQVGELMTRNVPILCPDDSLRVAAYKMDEFNVGALPVCDGERLIGMITDRDIAVRGVAQGRGPDTTVRELMTDDVVSVRADDNVEDVAAKMSEAQVRRVPVIDQDDKLCGIVSLGDLSRETGGEAASQALEGVSRPGGQHQQ